MNKALPYSRFYRTRFGSFVPEKDEEKKGRERFQRRILFLFIFFIAVIIITYFSLYVWLQWSILETMYLQKGGFDWFSINYYYNYTFITAAILALIVVNPRVGRSDIYGIWEAIWRLSQAWYRTEREPTFSLKNRRLTWFTWQVVKWGIAFLVIVLLNGLPFLGKITPAIYMAIKNVGSWNLVSRIFLLPVFPASSTEIISLMPTMEVQYNIFSFFATALLAVVAIRIVLKIIRNFIQEQQNVWIRDIFLILTLVMVAIIIGMPYWAMDVTTPFVFMISLLFLSGFLVATVYFQFIGLGRNLSFAERKRTLFLGLVIALIVGLLINAGFIAFYRLNWNNNWIQYEWLPLNQKQIDVTRWAAGIQDLERKSIQDLPMGNLTETLSQIRQWDQSAAYTRMINRIGANWMTLADSDIIYVSGHEFWVAPTTISYPSTDWISVHLIYTHTSKIISIDSHTGNYVNATDVFGIAEEPHIYYGEGFDASVYVNVEGFNEVENATYSGAPDFVLSGWQRSLWFASQGQFGFAFSPPQENINMLYNRDVLGRVQEILIHGLKVDSDAYPVSDGTNIYYAVQVYIDYRLLSGFTANNYVRNFAVVLVNVKDGTMQGYFVGKPDGFLVDFYKEYYPSWKQIDDPSASWLRPQLRYPEEVLGKQDTAGQLDADFIFHVSDPFVWRSGNQFYERPPQTEVLYVPVYEQSKRYFVGLQLVEYLGSEGKNLAGVYLAYGSEDLGKIILYEVPSTTQLLGPTSAQTSLIANQDVRTRLTFYGYYQSPPTARLGNILLYPIGGKLYYFIPMYLVGQVMSTMPQIGIIDASSGTAVALGSNAGEAYQVLAGVVIGEEKAAKERLAKVFQLFTEYNLVNVTAVNPDVEIQTGNLSYIGENQWNAAEAGINSFTQSYVANSTRILAWYPDDRTVNLGVLIKEQDFVYLYYISIKYT